MRVRSRDHFRFADHPTTTISAGVVPHEFATCRAVEFTWSCRFHGPTFETSLDELFAGFGSNVAALTDAVLLTSTLPGVVTFTKKKAFKTGGAALRLRLRYS